MTHGDDKGMIMPPRLAPHQVVIVPIYKDDSEQRVVLAAVEQIERALTAADIRVKVDRRDNLSPGYKFNDWELRGVPVRLELGPRDVEKGTVVLARRDIVGKAGKQFVPQEGVVESVQTLLQEIQANMLARAAEFQESHTQSVADYEGFKAAVESGFARAWWAGNSDEEEQVKAETKATIRCFPLDQPTQTGVCFYTGRPAQQVAIFGRSY
jgi:prolyl-tRNA synthetase